MLTQDNSSFHSASDHLEMRRGKIKIKRIENSASRHVLYSKWKNGILKKVKEISVLSNAVVSLIIFSSSGVMFEFCTPMTTSSKMLERYQQNSRKTIWDAEIDSIMKENDNMQIELKHLKGEDLNLLNPRELQSIKDALQKGLASVREKQMDFLKMLRKNERVLEEENKQLTYMLLHQKLSLNGTVRELQHDYHHKEKDFASQIPLAFRV